MTAILRLQLDDKDPVRVNSAINQLAEYIDRNPVPTPSLARTLLTANTTFYVATTGSNANPGTAGSPFLTIQHAYDYIVSSLDTAGFTITVQLADGTYTAGLLATASWSGGGQIVFQGNATTPANVVINTSLACFNVACPVPAQITVQNMKLTSSGNHCISFTAPGIVAFQNIEFGIASANHIFSGSVGASIRAIGNYKISGGAQIHASANNGGDIQTVSLTVTFVGTPAFSAEYAGAFICGTYECFSITFVGSFTGIRYNSSYNGVIFTGGGGANYFPGTSPGITDGFGVYI